MVMHGTCQILDARFSMSCSDSTEILLSLPGTFHSIHTQNYSLVRYINHRMDDSRFLFHTAPKLLLTLCPRRECSALSCPARPDAHGLETWAFSFCAVPLAAATKPC